MRFIPLYSTSPYWGWISHWQIKIQMVHGRRSNTWKLHQRDRKSTPMGGIGISVKIGVAQKCDFPGFSALQTLNWQKHLEYWVCKHDPRPLICPGPLLKSLQRVHFMALGWSMTELLLFGVCFDWEYIYIYIRFSPKKMWVYQQTTVRLEVSFDDVDPNRWGDYAPWLSIA